MKRSTFDGQVVVYRYGCPSWADLDDEAMRQLRLVHDLRNELVAIEHRYEQMHAAFWLSFPEVSAAQAVVDEATAEVERVAAQMRADRVVNRSTIPAVEAKALLAAARKIRAQAKADLKAVKERLKPQMQARRRELDDAKRYALGKENVDRHFVQGLGLGWGSKCDTVDRHQVAARRVREARRQGQPAQHRFHRWTGEGTLTILAQPTRDGGRRAVWGFEPARPAVEWTGQPRAVAESPNPRRRTLWLQIGRSRQFGPHVMRIPIVVHRPLPEGGEVTCVRVTRRRVADSYRLSVTFTVRLPAATPKVSDEAVAVRLGWASVGEHLRVAQVISGLGALPPPPVDIAELLRPYAGGLDFHVSAVWRRLLDRDDSIRSVRDDLLDELRPHVVEALADPELAEAVDATPGEAARWRAFGRFARLAMRWPQDHPLAGKLVAWQARDRHLWQFEAHERQQVIARRRDAYRKFAAWICDHAGVVAVHGLDLAELRRVPGVDEQDTPQARGARRNAVVAAPGELRAAIVAAAGRRGVQVMYASEESR